MKDKLDVITLRGLSAVGSHGVHDFERSGSQVFSADLKLYLDATKAAETDDVQYTVDYGAIAEDAVAILTGTPVYLLETLANQLAQMALTYPLVQIVEVTVHKPMAPVRHHFSDVSVTIRRSRGSELLELLGSKSTVSRPAKDDAPTDTGAAPEEEEIRTSPCAEDQVEGVEEVVEQGSATEAREPDPDTLEAESFEAPLEEPAAEEPVADVVEEGSAEPTSPRTFPSRTSLHGTPAEEPIEERVEPVEVAVLPPVPRRADRHRAKRERGREIAPITSTVRAVRDNRHAPLNIDRSFDDASHVYDVVLALGSNQGPILENLSGAVEALANTPGFEVVEVSPLVRTEPVLEPGALPQPDYYNAIVVGRTVIVPPVLLQTTQYIEREFGRVPGRRWSSRPLDIDIIKIDQMRVRNKDLILPHPRAKERAFVLYPWWLIDNDAVLIDDEKIADYLQDAPDLGGVLGVREDWLGKTGRPDRGEEEVELAPRTSARRGRMSVSKDTPVVEVRGEKLHLAPLEGDPIFQQLIDGEKRVQAKRQTKPEQREEAPADHQVEVVAEPSVNETPEMPEIPQTLEEAGAPEEFFEPEGAADFAQQAFPAAQPVLTLPEPTEPQPRTPRALPDWRFSVSPPPSRIVDDTSRVIVRDVDETGGTSATDGEGEEPAANGAAVTPSQGISTAPRPRVARRVTLRPTPTGSEPVARRGRKQR